jgi:hypothetical protein
MTLKPTSMKAYTDGYRGPAFNGYEFFGIESLETKPNGTRSLVYIGEYNTETNTVRRTLSPVYYIWYDYRAGSMIYNDHHSAVLLNGGPGWANVTF